jgi:hypothetical protein
MPAQPSFDGRGLAVRQEIDDTATFEVTDQGAVTLATPPRPVIDPDHTRRIGAVIGNGTGAA